MANWYSFTRLPLLLHIQKKEIYVYILRKIYIVWWTWTRVFSSLKKLKTWWGGRGSQREVAALTIIPQGWPGSLLLRTDTRTPLLLTSFNWGKSSFPVMLNIPQKFFTILWESFIMLLLPSGKLSTGQSHH